MPSCEIVTSRYYVILFLHEANRKEGEVLQTTTEMKAKNPIDRRIFLSNRPPQPDPPRRIISGRIFVHGY